MAKLVRKCFTTSRGIMAMLTTERVQQWRIAERLVDKRNGPLGIRLKANCYQGRGVSLMPNVVLFFVILSSPVMRAITKMFTKLRLFSTLLKFNHLTCARDICTFVSFIIYYLLSLVRFTQNILILIPNAVHLLSPAQKASFFLQLLWRELCLLMFTTI